MKRTAHLAILLFALSAFLAPVAGVVHGCDEESDDVCCTAGCALCLCCAHQPQYKDAAETLAARFVPGPLDNPWAASSVSTDPRDILHVPIPALSR